MADPRDSRGALVRRAVIADSPAIRRIRNAAIRDSLAIWTEREQDPDEAVAWLEPQIARGTALVAVERDDGGERDGGDGGERMVSASPSRALGTPTRDTPARSRTPSTSPPPPGDGASAPDS